MAHQITTTSRASSDGWKLIGPMSTQRRAPLIDGAIARVKGSRGNEKEDEGGEQQRPGELAPSVVIQTRGKKQQNPPPTAPEPCRKANPRPTF